MKVNYCRECDDLVENRSQIVNGRGPKDADLLLVGEAPGKNEDEQGKPFVGKSGDILDDVLQANNLPTPRITNTVRCRPPDNRDPRTGEIENCNAYLMKEIDLVDPDVIVPLGRIATSAILGDNLSITEIAGDKYQMFNATVIPNLHPAATAYRSSYRDTFLETFRIIRDHIDN